MARDSRLTDSRPQTLDSQISDFRFQILGFRFQISDFGFQISDFRFHISDFGFQTRTGDRKTVRCPRINSDSRPPKKSVARGSYAPKAPYRFCACPLRDRLWSVPAFFQLSIPKILFRVLCRQGVIQFSKESSCIKGFIVFPS